MKKIIILYWFFTGLLSALMLLGSIPDILSASEAVALFKHLGYPAYLLPFIGIAKLLGVLAILPSLQPLFDAPAIHLLANGQCLIQRDLGSSSTRLCDQTGRYIHFGTKQLPKETPRKLFLMDFMTNLLNPKIAARN